MSDPVQSWQRRAYNIEALRLLARKALPRPIFDFADGGAEKEYTLRRNEAAFDEIELVPHPLSGAPERDMSVSLFGKRLSLPLFLGPTGLAGSPFLAANVHLREEVDFGGDLTVQAGWLWRGTSGQTLRFGAHYLNGKSSQYQNFDQFEEQIGAGLWYDF